MLNLGRKQTFRLRAITGESGDSFRRAGGLTTRKQTFSCQQLSWLQGRSRPADWDDHGHPRAVNPIRGPWGPYWEFRMTMGKTLLLAAVLAAAPFTVSGASAQNTHSNMTSTTMQQRDRATVDRNQTDQRGIRDRSIRDRDMRDRDMRHRDDRDMRHHGWSRGHHYGWRHCVTRWHHHRRVRVCR